MSLEINEIAQLAANAAQDKKATDVVILDIQGLSLIADYFVVCTGNSETQVQAIASAIKEKMHEAQVDIKGAEGLDQSRWVLIDLGDVVVHIFHKDDRDFYKIERLWKDAPRVELKEIQE